jgi:hypothetical protein
MDFSTIYQLRNKKYWWLDAIFYFAISTLIAMIFCYFIFSIKVGMEKKDISKEDAALTTVGTPDQRSYEKNVLEYQKKINDFNNIFKNHQFASNVFAFMQDETMPYIWFKQFSLDPKNSAVQVSGEADNMDNFSRQVAVFENNNYVKKIGLLNSTVDKTAKIEFNLNIALDPKIFNYLTASSSLAPLTPLMGDTTPAFGATPAVVSQPVTKNQSSLTESTSQAQTSFITTSVPAPAPKSGEKKIILFNIPSSPDIIGKINEQDHTVELDFPSSTDSKNMSFTPLIVISANASIYPASQTGQDFSSPITYLVKAENGSSQDYVVTAKILPKAVSNSNNALGVVVFFIVTLIILVAVVVVFLLIKRRKKYAN